MIPQHLQWRDLWLSDYLLLWRDGLVWSYRVTRVAVTRKGKARKGKDRDGMGKEVKARQ